MMIVSSDYPPYLFAGPRRICSKRALLGLRWFLRNRDNAFGKNGGADGTVSHWKYIIGNAIVYRASRDLEGSALRSISFLNFSAAAPFSLTLTLRDPREWKTGRGTIDGLHPQTDG